MMLQVIVRPMRLSDIEQVVQIDRLSFSTPWSANAYRFELTNRDTSHLVVLELASPANHSAQRWRWLSRLFTRQTPAGQLVGYGGCWLIAGEAHISTIAVHPDFRGQGLGELLLASMLKRAILLHGEYSVLEVRESNVTAQALYRKYEYRVVGRRRHYYRDDGEDALLMEARPLDAAYAQRLDARWQLLASRIQFDDQFTHAYEPERSFL
ncbi:MAG: ribosomal-protein-alanine acetyltransferase [Anaerolineae bacterium]|nr:MAG: ribosomal-protein-alanine acetyltransferase [Anaerolineae bacterium]